MKKIGDFLIETILHGAAVGVILFAFFPMAQWYFDATPLWGVDFFYTVTLVTLLKSHLVLAPLAWNHIWFAGWPMIINYPFLHYFLIAPFTLFFSVIACVKWWNVISLALFFVGNYACFFVLSRNRAISVALAIAGIYCIGVYGALMWGGSLPNHATQAFFPWVLWCILLYLRGSRIKYVFASALLTGLAILGHPQIVIAYIFPASVFTLFFAFGTVPFWKRIRSILLYVFVSVLIALPLLSSNFSALKYLFLTNTYTVATSTVKVDQKVSGDIIAFHHQQPWRIWTDSNHFLFYAVAPAVLLYIVSVFFKRKKKYLLRPLPFVLLTLYFVGYIWLFAYGISIYHGGWYRLFWSVPVWMGLLCAAFWGGGYEAIVDKVPTTRYGLSLVLLFTTVMVSVWYLPQTIAIKDAVIARSQTSSAFPDIVNLKTNPEEIPALRARLAPQWLPVDSTDYRLYSGDQLINIWWNSYFAMPLLRGYLDPPKTDAFFWFDASVSRGKDGTSDQLTESFGYPPEIALNNTLFLLDWYGVKYFESERESTSNFSALPPSLHAGGYIEKEETLDFNDVKYSTGHQSLHFLKLKDELVTPILTTSGAPTLGIVASENGFNTVVRAIADAKLGLHQVIPVYLGKDLDRISSRDLEDMDGLLVYDYSYYSKSKAFKLLSDYVQKGKRLFIDTGTEVAQSKDVHLPDIFPMENSKRQTLGTEWDFVIGDDPLIDDVNFADFSPPLFDQLEWNFSYSTDESDIREDTNILLKNHGQPILMTYNVGGTPLVWSGMNFPYHVIRFHNSEEVKLFRNIISYILEPAKAKTEIEESRQFINPGQRTITTRNGRGVVFKEMAYPGWRANIVVNGQKVGAPIYKVGPAYPGFMYVAIPRNYQGDTITVTFTYWGSLANWFFSILSFVVSIFIIDEVVIKGWILGKLTRKIISHFHFHVQKWWKKEDEV